MKYISLIFIGILFTVGAQYQAYGGCPSPSTLPCITGCTPGDRPCPGGDLCCPTACGTYTCASPVNSGIPPWCPPGSPTINCLVNPCQFDRCPRFPRARCINDNPCELACEGNFYIGFWRIPRRLCNADYPANSYRTKSDDN